jgi:pimeloyl-ACP methyl ester carboxylesterase
MLHYEIFPHSSSKEWVVFIHGAGGSSSIWFKQLRAFSKSLNVLLIDLRGHGKSKNTTNSKNYTFREISHEVVDVLDALKIYNAHFVGISLGTIVIRDVAEIDSKRVKSMIMGGAVIKLNIKSQVLLKLGVWFKSLIPYMFLYKFFAFVIMPNHKNSRSLFVNEAKKLAQKEFKRWFTLTGELKPLLKFFRSEDIGLPTLYIMGDQDYMFLPSVREVVSHHKKSDLFVIDNCGHVVNVDQPRVFNNVALDFIFKQT